MAIAFRRIIEIWRKISHFQEISALRSAMPDEALSVIRYSLSLLSIVSDDDISVGVRPLRALLIGERIVQFET